MMKMTRAQREEEARKHECPRCLSPAGKPCRSHIPQYTPLGYDHPIYGRPMKHPHAERLALVPR